MTRVLVLTSDPVGERMAGPAIRAWNIALVLAEAGHEVRLVTTSRLDPQPAPFAQLLVPPGRQRAFAKEARWADVIVVQGHGLSMFRALRSTRAHVVADIYDPMHVEQLEQARELPAAEYREVVADRTKLLNEQLLYADFLVCASERQRVFYLGQLAALGRLNPLTYDGDSDLSRVIAVAPFGLPGEEPEHGRQVVKGVVPGIAADDKLVIWGGGLYSWFDPLTLIRAMAVLVERRPEVRLFFQGTKHPSLPEMPIVAESRALAAELGVLDRAVFFNETWVPYHERQDYLLEADAGVSTHGVHLETMLAFRTRILDYLWTGLPMVVTEGDSFAELVEREGLGAVVAAGDPDDLADALERVLFDPETAASARAEVRRVRERFRWASALAPLVEYVAAPWRAPDRAYLDRHPVAAIRLVTAYGAAHGLRRSAHYLASAGPAGFARKVRERLGARSRRANG